MGGSTKCGYWHRDDRTEAGKTTTSQNEVFNESTSSAVGRLLGVARRNSWALYMNLCRLIISSFSSMNVCSVLLRFRPVSSGEHCRLFAERRNHFCISKTNNNNNNNNSHVLSIASRFSALGFLCRFRPSRSEITKGPIVPVNGRWDFRFAQWLDGRLLN